MGELVLAALSPHPPIIIPEVGGAEASRASATVNGMTELASEVAAARPDTIVVISPHAPVFADVIAVLGLPKLHGDFRQFGSDWGADFENDLDLGHAIVREAESCGIASAVLDEELARRVRVTRTLDHGTMVPLYYISKSFSSGFAVVPVSMGVGPEPELYRFGIAVRRAIEASDRRVALVASGDLSHRLKPGAPAGYRQEGRVYDEKIIEALRDRDGAAIAAFDDGLVEAAGECGQRPIFMMLGSIDGRQVEARVHSYEGPFGVGYGVVSYVPTGRPEESRLPAVEAASSGKVAIRRRSESPFVALARRAVETYVASHKVVSAPNPLPGGMEGRAGVFCSIHKGRELRGCIGTISPTCANIAEEIIRNAISAAMHDPRFDEVEEDELDDLVYSVDVLMPPERIGGPAELDPKKYGVIVTEGARSGLLLPDLEGIDTAEEQIAIAKRKAGIRPDEPVDLERFEVTRYE